MGMYSPDPGMSPPMMGMDPSMMMGPPPAQDQGPSGPDLLKQAIELLKQYAEGETEEEDTAAALNFAAGIQKLLAKQAKEADTALGVGPGARFLRRSNA